MVSSEGHVRNKVRSKRHRLRRHRNRRFLPVIARDRIILPVNATLRFIAIFICFYCIAMNIATSLCYHGLRFLYLHTRVAWKSRIHQISVPPLARHTLQARMCSNALSRAGYYEREPIALILAP